MLQSVSSIQNLKCYVANTIYQNINVKDSTILPIYVCVCLSPSLFLPFSVNCSVATVEAPTRSLLCPPAVRVDKPLFRMAVL